MKLFVTVDQVDHEYTTFFLFSHVVKGDNWYVSLFEENFNIAFFSDTF